MKNQHESLETDAKPKMLFNTDGFNFLVKFVTVLFTVIGAVLLVVLKIIGALCANSSKSNQSNEDNSIYPIDDVIVRRDENGTGYNADGDII